MVAPGSALLSLALAVTPQEEPRVSAVRPALPCLVGEADNPVVRATLTLDAPRAVTELGLGFAGTVEPDHVTGLRLRIGDGEHELALDPSSPSATVVFEPGLALGAGAHELTVLLDLDAATPLDGRVLVSLDSLTLDGELLLLGGTQGPPQLLGRAVRRAGDDGCAVHRIPALATSSEGTLLAAYDLRWNGWRDLPGDIDVGVSRSTDRGQTWTPMRVALDMGDDEAASFDGVGDPSILVDRETGRIWIAALWSHGDRAWHGSGPGLTPDETGQLVLAHSDDDGLTWSAPRNLTAEVKDPAWALCFNGPGRGIQTRDGTLVFAAQFREAPERGQKPHSTVLWSDDHGASWHMGTGVAPDTTEAQVVELPDGAWMLNTRDDRGGSRRVAVTRDRGRTWTEHPTSRGALIEPVCNAALLDAGGGTFVFSNPQVAQAPRRRMSVRASFDHGASWPAQASILLDEGQSAGYSSMTPIDDAVVGVLYESSRAQLVFQRVPLAELRALR